MLQLTDLSIAFRRYRGLFRQEEVQVVSDVTLQLEPGEILALIGASGAGKSLLALAILGLLPPNARMSGTIRFAGHDLARPYPKGIRGRRIAFLPQQAGHLDPTARVGAQLRLSASRVGAAPDVTRRLTDVGLPPDTAGAFPHQLSGGMARRVLAAQCMAGAPELIIADEPTVGLDPASRTRVLGSLRADADRGAAVLLITHDLLSVLPYSDRVTVMQDGQVCVPEDAQAFEGAGHALTSSFARALWRALPQNGLHADA